MAKVVWTERALQWLRKIDASLAEVSEAYAAKTTDGIYNQTRLLQKFPRTGWRLIEVAGREVRVLMYGHYRIVYEVAGSDEVRILLIVHSAMDFDQFGI